MTAFLPQNLTLSCHQVRLEKLTLSHQAAIADAVCDGQLWQLVVTSAPKPDDVLDYIQTALKTRYAFAVIDEQTNRCVGTTSYYDVIAQIPRLEIGYTWYSQSAQRTRINSTCKFMLLKYAFEMLGCYVVGWQTDVINIRSQTAIERLGAKRDGVVRGQRARKDGTIRDTVYYSMLNSEWPAAKAQLLAKLGIPDQMQIHTS